VARSLAHPRLYRSLGTRLVHTYTRTPIGDGALNDDYAAVPDPGAAVTGVQCLYEDRRTSTLGPEGRAVLIVPTLYILPGDPLQAGDQVSAIKDVNGATIYPGPYHVDRVTPYDGLGPVVMREATLSRGEGSI
jgi:hypothetical protein